MKAFAFVFALATIVNGDMYLHNPRGSNNRLDERGRERNNANRMFDSQNNNRGGYNVGSLYYYGGSILPIEWTNQHSCGDPNNHCEIIIQYMCGKRVRDGTTTQTIPDNPVQCQNYDCNNDLRYGMHEDYSYYQNCKYRERNNGLFTADQNLKNRKAAKYTRQNPGGTRRGYECPEERDYYPYWHPSPWKDIVIMTNDVKRCPYYQEESQNVKSRWACVTPPQYTKHMKMRRMVIPIDKESCEKITWPLNYPNGTRAKWTEFPAHDLPAPDCRETMWSRDNHLGNGKGGYANKYNWTVPNIKEEHCTLRIRYNISTNDYDGWKTNASANGRPVTKVDIGSRFGMNTTVAEERGYVFKNNPEIQILGGSVGKKLKLRLAINTAQYGRTFQDRSHTFAIRERPSNLKSARIFNLNVRGKRGNIVQVYPAVEYDFIPNRLIIGKDDYVHFQWTGSNTNPGNNDGQGLAGTDRSNVVLLKAQRYSEGSPESQKGKNGHFGNNHPEHLDKTTFLGLPKEDLTKLALLRPGQFGGEMSELDDAGTYFDLGPRKITSAGTNHYMSTRNNNFSNRSQKGKIVVMTNPIAEKQIGWSGGNVVLNDGSEGVWIGKDTLNGVKQVQVQKWSASDGENYIKSKGGSISAGDDYASNYLAIFPQETLTKDGKTFTVKMKIEKKPTTSTSMLYHSVDGKSWSQIQDVEYSGGTATFQASKGGFYVVRSSKNYGMIAGISIACIVILVLIVGTTIYCRRKPESWSNFKGRVRNLKRGFQSEV